MNDSIEVLLDLASGCSTIPSIQAFQVWACAAYLGTGWVQLSVRVVDEEESRALNFQYRNKNRATNVLSFPLHVPCGEQTELLGDLVICAPVVEREAAEEGKTAQAHWAHMLVHGMLHLQGYDHEEPREAEVMEKLEIEVLEKLGFSDPY